ncbi:hypothetical protein BDP27DRAFT_1320423 [Rhodocollybia butyracea]|uniref:DUF6699 domain-containing protein n=1 Tax=Rhodocollybia butyracea TaxID=206335 RepID=A0A9P5UAV4_9AGAR|nr:hypothetical protein BDP27DRAFT_1320423 [Rhodocollybia butyracea]
MPRFRQIHQLLEQRPFMSPDQSSNPSLIFWNILEAPSTSLRLNSAVGRFLQSQELTSFATHPSVTRLRILCGILPDTNGWRIEARNPRGVTVKDVFMAIYLLFQQPYSNEEFSTLCPKTQTRVLDAYHARVRATANPQKTWERGMNRVDCLMRHSWFGGLSLTYGNESEMEDTCILSLRVEEDTTLISPTQIVPSPFR